MNRLPLFAAIVATILAAGCKGTPPAEPASPPPTDTHLAALEPPDMAQDVSLTPRFFWRLPTALSVPTSVSFSLAEAGQGDQPVKDAAAEKPLAFASGLADVSPTMLAPFHPPSGCILTGDLTDMKHLQPNTWHRWSVRVIGAGDVPESQFFFRTQADGTAPPPATPNK